MAFTKETAAKAGAKSSRKGTPNKQTKEFRERLSTLLDDRWDTFIQDLDKLSPRERVDTMVKLMEYTIPKLSRTEIDDVTDIEKIMQLSPDERLARLEELKKLKKVV